MENKVMEDKPTPAKIKSKSKRNIISLGWVSFFGGLSQDMIVPLLPVYYSQVLGLNKEIIGFIEGFMQAIVSTFKIVSGVISDKLGKRKSLVFIGYLFSAVSRVFLFLAGGALGMLGLRSLDGVGKGLKEAPIDALVATSSDDKNMGFAFGLQRTLDTLGSVVGPLVASFLLIKFASLADAKKYKTIFIIGGLTAFITLIIVKLFVAERDEKTSGKDFKLDFSLLKGKFLLFFIVMMIFTLGNSSDAFLILKAKSTGINTATITLIVALFNLFYAGLSIPSGVLSDKIGRVNVIRLGWLVYALTYVGFAAAKSPWQIWVLYGMYGVYYSTTEGVAKSLVAKIVPENMRGTAFGLYNASVGLFAIPASTVAGLLWDKVSSSAPFYFGAACAVLAIILITFLKIEDKEK